MSSYGLLATCAGLLSIAGLLMEFVSGGELVLAGAPRFVPVALPWLAIAGLPRRHGTRPPVIALALLPLGWAVGLDYAQGRLESLRAVMVTVVLLFGWFALAELSGSRPSRQQRYAWLWLLLVALPPVLLVSHGWASGTPAEHGPTIVEASPLVWLHAQGLVSDSWLGALPPLLGLGLVALVVLYDPRERRSDP